MYSPSPGLSLDVFACVDMCDRGEHPCDSLYYSRRRRRSLWSRHLRRSSDRSRLSVVR